MAAAMRWPVEAEGGRFIDDIAGLAETFQANAKKMFMNTEGTDIGAFVIGSFGCRRHKLRSLKEIDIVFNESSDLQLEKDGIPSPAIRIFFLRQRHSRSEISISQAAMIDLFSRVHVFPEFVNIITSFGLPGTMSGLSGSDCVDHLSGNFYARNHETGNSVFQTAYTLKYTEKNHRQNGPIWSTRHMAIYQHYNQSNKLSNCILVQVSEHVERRLSTFADKKPSTNLSAHWTVLHEVCLGTLVHNWREFMQYQLDKFRSGDFYYHTDAQPTFNDIKNLSLTMDIISRAVHALEHNNAVLKLLSEEATRREKIEGQIFDERYSEFLEALRRCTTDHKFLLQKATLLRTFTERRSAQLRDAIALQDSNAMMALNQKTIRETRTMRTITLVALIYLPASFTATFVGMDLIHVESLSGVMRLSVSDDMWFYFAITAPLMFVTLLLWWLWELRTRRNLTVDTRVREDENLKDV